jgi:4-hydroxy-tetrahydrodipicolinate synthase
LDEQTLRSLVKRQIEEGINFLVPCGTSGESPTLTHKEHLRVVEITLEEANGRVPVLAGAGGYNTAEVIELGKEIKALGADGLLSVTPYYNKPTQEGLFQHFREIARNTKLPIVLYSVPSRCGVEISVETVRRLAAEFKNIIGIKEAGGSCDRVSALRAALGPKFEILSGDDSLTIPFMSVGAQGVISVASNIAPREVAQMVKAYASGETEKASRIHQKFYQLFKDLFIESNPIPVKAALAMMGQIEEEYRLPLVPMSGENRKKLQKTLDSLGFLK